MNTSALQPTQTHSGLTAADAVVCWRLVVLATNDPLLLPRVLQKLAVPEIELHAAHYDAGVPGGGASVELIFATHAARARLAAVRMQKLIGMRDVTLEPAGNV